MATKYKLLPNSSKGAFLKIVLMFNYKYMYSVGSQFYGIE